MTRTSDHENQQKKNPVLINMAIFHYSLQRDTTILFIAYFEGFMMQQQSDAKMTSRTPSIYEIIHF